MATVPKAPRGLLRNCQRRADILGIFHPTITISFALLGATVLATGNFAYRLYAHFLPKNWWQTGDEPKHDSSST